MKYWEIIADKLSDGGYSWGYRQVTTYGTAPRWVVDAQRNGKTYIVECEELLSAFVELERAVLK
jgi:hypothetical protein